VTETERASRQWNPLRCDGTPLPPGCLLAAKMLALSFYRAGHFGRDGMIVHIAAHRLAYANNVLFVTVFLLLIGLYHPRTGLLPLRVQIAFVYGGAAVNKVFDPDWWNGRFFDTLMGEALLVDWYRSLSASWRPGWLGSALGAATIAIETAIAAAVLFLRDGRAGVLLMVGFHLVMLAATGGRLSVPFLYGAFAVSAAFFYAPIDIPALRSRPRLTLVVSPALWWLGAMFIQWPGALTPAP
jgi:hypothetical protein